MVLQINFYNSVVVKYNFYNLRVPGSNLAKSIFFFKKKKKKRNQNLNFEFFESWQRMKKKKKKCGLCGNRIINYE